MSETIQVPSSGSTKRVQRTPEEKRRVVEATLVPGAPIARVARRNGVNANRVFQWRTVDRALLEALFVAQQEQMRAKDEALAVEREKRLSHENEIEHLKLVIAKLQRMIFGTKSEKVTREIEQLELKLEELETGQAERASTATKAGCHPRSDAKRFKRSAG